MDSVSVCMLGDRATGKTCFLTAMYIVMSESINGFTFSAEDDDHDLDFGEAWTRFVEEQIWPEPTKQTQDLAFNFHYGGSERLGTFLWKDYRGGALSERSTSEDKQELKDFARESDCLIVCLPAKDLPTTSRPQLPEQLRKLNQLLQGIDPVPVVLALTKADESNLTDMTWGVEALAKNPLTGHPMWQYLAEDAGWDVLVCPVSLGIGLESEEFIYPQTQAKGRRLIAGEIRPHNVHVPVVFGLFKLIERYRNSAAAAAQEYSSEAKRARAAMEAEQSRFLNLFFKQGERVERSRMEEAQRVSEDALKEANKKGRHMELILKGLMPKDLWYFENGKRKHFGT